MLGPFLAIGLHEKSGRLHGDETASLRAMATVRPASGAQLAYAGLLGLLVIFRLRAAGLLCALYFGFVRRQMYGCASIDLLKARLVETS